jgi:tetratricopeptide (TPR) repeat protein
VSRFGGVVVYRVENNPHWKKQNSNGVIPYYITHEKKVKPANQNICYVDSDGNLVSHDDIDPNTMEFEDEYGRSVDADGNLIDTPESDAKAVEIAERILASENHSELIQHCERNLENDLSKNNPKLWHLLGIGHATQRNISKARECFLQAAINSAIDSFDSLAFGNYVTASFDLGDTKPALTAIERFFNHLDFDGKRIILDSLLEAVRTGLVRKNDLSEKLKGILNLD